MNLPLTKAINSKIEEVEQMAEVVDEEDVKMFLINNKKKAKKSSPGLNRFYHPKESISEYFKDNNRVDLTTEKLHKFLENGILDNVLFNFLFSRGSDLKEGLIDVNRAYTFIQKINENELDNPEKVPERSLNDSEKWEIV